MATTPMRIGDRTIGNHHPAYVIAEIGLNHNGDLDLAERTIVAASQAGADAVKFQNYRTEDFVSDHTLTHTYCSQGKLVEEAQFDLFKRCELKPDNLARLNAVCRHNDIDFISTPTSHRGVAELVEIGVAAIKNGSDYLGHLPIIDAMARSGLPVSLSTGMADAQDIAEAVAAFDDAGGRELGILHCVSLYPTPAAELNLHRMATLRAAFGRPVGLSDHSEGVVSAAVAVSLGASIVEKHFTLDRSLPGPDHEMSSDPAELDALVKAIRYAETALGAGELVPAAGENAARRMHRLSCVAAHPLAAGHTLSAADIAFRRPGTGLRPALADGLVGRSLRVDVPNGHIFSWADFG